MPALLRTASYARKVRKLFQHMDDSGDGALSLDEPLGDESVMFRDLCWTFFLDLREGEK